MTDDELAGHPQRGDRLHLPDLPAAAARDGAGQRGAAAGLPGHAREGAARAGEGGAGQGGADAPHAPPAQRAVRRPAAARGHRAGAGGRAVACSWRTSPRATWTRPRARRSSGSSSSCTGQGTRCVLVTHEPKLAARCPRAIRLSDGDDRRGRPGAAGGAGRARPWRRRRPRAAREPRGLPRRRAGGRRASRCFSLGANRMRTVLTTLGIGIGVATLLAIVGIIQGLNTSFERQLGQHRRQHALRLQVPLGDRRATGGSTATARTSRWRRWSGSAPQATFVTRPSRP